MSKVRCAVHGHETFDIIMRKGLVGPLSAWDVKQTSGRLIFLSFSASICEQERSRFRDTFLLRSNRHLRRIGGSRYVVQGGAVGGG